MSRNHYDPGRCEACGGPMQGGACIVHSCEFFNRPVIYPEPESDDCPTCKGTGEDQQDDGPEILDCSVCMGSGKAVPQA